MPHVHRYTHPDNDAQLNRDYISQIDDRIEFRIKQRSSNRVSRLVQSPLDGDTITYTFYLENDSTEEDGEITYYNHPSIEYLQDTHIVIEVLYASGGRKRKSFTSRNPGHGGLE